MKERQISQEIQRFVRLTGGEVWSTEQGYRRDRGGTRTSPGIPDLIVIYETAWTFAEIKTPKGKQSPAQRFFESVCRNAGLPYTIWRDVRDAFDWATAHGIVEQI